MIEKCEKCLNLSKSVADRMTDSTTLADLRMIPVEEWNADPTASCNEAGAGGVDPFFRMGGGCKRKEIVKIFVALSAQSRKNLACLVVFLC